MLCRVLFSYPLLCLFLTGLLFQQSLLKCYSAQASSGVVLRRALRGQGAPAIYCRVGVSPLLSQDGVSTKAKHRDKQDGLHEDGDRTAGNGATGVMDWEQESETRDRRLCHRQQHGILGTEEKLGKGSRGHTCSWTCLSGTSVSPPRPCIQSPVLTGTRSGGLSVILRAKTDLSLPLLGPGCYQLPVLCCRMQRQTPQPPRTNTRAPGQCSAWMGQAHHINAHQLSPQVPHTVSLATGPHTGELCFSETMAHGTPCTPRALKIEPQSGMQQRSRPQVHISDALSNTPCRLGPAGLQTCRQSPGLHPSGRSAFQHQQHTRVLLRTERRDSVT